MRIKDTDWSMAKRVICHILYYNNVHREVVKRRFLLLGVGGCSKDEGIRKHHTKGVQKGIWENRAYHFVTDQKGYLSLGSTIPRFFHCVTKRKIYLQYNATLNLEFLTFKSLAISNWIPKITM